MSDTATKNSLEVTIIDGISARLLAQSISQSSLPDGDTRHNFGTIDTDSLQKFKDGIAAKNEGESREDQIYLQVWVPHRKDGNGYLQLTDLINSKKAAVPMPDAQGDIDKYLQWRKEVNEPTEDFGPYSLRIHLSGGIRALVEGEEKEVAGLFETIRCTLYAVGSGLVADVGGMYFYVPDIPKSARQIISWHNAKLGIETPAKLTEWAKANQRTLVVKSITAQSPNFPGDRDFYRSLTLRDQPDAWKENKNEGTRYHDGKNCTVTYQPDELFSEAWWIETREETLAALDRRFRSIRNDLTADVADILFHHWLANRKLNASGSAVEKVAITFSQICEYRGVQAKPKAIDMVYEALRDVRAFSLKDGKIDERLFDISTIEIQPALWHGTEQPGKDTGLIYSPGFFLSKAVEGEFFTACFASKVWELDPYRYPAAKRLARYLRGEWRMNTQTYLNHDGANLHRFRQMKAILNDAGISYDGSEAQKDPTRFIESIEKGIRKLHQDGIIRDDCPEIFHPEDRADWKALPRKGILAQWLQLRVRIDPPAEVRDELARLNTKRMARSEQARALPEAKKRGRKTGKA